MRHAITGAAAALAAVALAAPAAAQPSTAPAHVDEIVVTGPTGPTGPSRLSRTVSFADLDLATLAGQDILRLRVRDAADDLCRALGEANAPGDALVPSCQDKAFRDARPKMRAAIDRAEAQAYAAY